MATEPLTGSRIPDLSFAPDITQVGTAVRDLADNTIPQFANNSARDSAYTAWVASGYTMRDGLWCVVGTTVYQYVAAASAWVEMGSAGAGFTSFTPTWTASVTTPVVGNGTLTGRYRKIGRQCHFNIELKMGSTTNPGTGLYSFSGLPFTSVGGYEQEVLAKCTTTAGALRNWSGFAFIGSSTTAAVPFFTNSTGSWDQCRQTDSSGTTGTSVPFVSGANAFTTSSNIIIQGAYETSS